MVRSGRDFSRSSSELFSVTGAPTMVLPKGKSGTLPLTLAGVLLTLLLPYASRMPHFPLDGVSEGATLLIKAFVI